MSDSKLPNLKNPSIINAVCEQNIIDYPRHIRFSSKFESVAKIQNDMRRQKIFHKEFQPHLNDSAQLAILEGVYKPNQPIDKDSSTQYVNEFIRKQGKMYKEPHVKPMKDVIKIYGKTNDPRFQNSILARSS